MYNIRYSYTQPVTITSSWEAVCVDRDAHQLAHDML
jgi:hypothetical protein